MRVVDLREEWVDGWKYAAATVIWERRKHPPQDIHVGTSEKTSDMLETSPNCFLLAALLPAVFHFEKRIEIEGPVCPTLLSGLRAAMEVHYQWYRDAPPIEIDTKSAPEPFSPDPRARSAVFMSGGVDSLASLRANRREHDLADKESYVYGVVLSSGFDIFEIQPGDWYWERLEAVARDASLHLVPLRTNIRDLETSDHFFGNHFFGALMVTQAHALASHIDHVTIASAGLVSTPEAEGSHPDLDHLYGSGNVRVTHDEGLADRFDRIRLISDWGPAQDGLKVCFVPSRAPAGLANCGRCEKCLRTMLSLLAIGALERFEVFEPTDITPEYLREHLQLTIGSADYYPRIAQELQIAGRDDLVPVIHTQIREAKKHNLGTVQRLKRFERDRLGGILRRSKRRLIG